MVEIKTVKIDFPKGCNVILGQSHFIKTVEDIYEAIVTSVPGAKFGVAFCESSGPCLIRHDGTDSELENIAVKNALAVSSGHFFIIVLGNIYPINVLNTIKNIQEVCTIYCATANPVEVIIAETENGRGILGVIDGFKSKGIEGEKEKEERKKFLRDIGYKR